MIEQRERPDLRVPPHNLEAEQSLLGAMLLSRDAIADAVEVVTTDHFYRPAHAHIFDAVCALYASGDPVDPAAAVEYHGHKIGFCCNGCVGGWEKKTDEEKQAIVAKYTK